MSQHERRAVVLRLIIAFAGSLLLVLAGAGWWIHEQQEDAYAELADTSAAGGEQLANSLLQHLLVGSLVTFIVGVVVAWLLVRSALRPVERMRQRERRLLAEAGHELRTPLAAIALEAELALEEAPPEEVATSLRAIIHEAHALAELAEDVLDLARGEQATVVAQAFDLGELVSERVVRARARHELRPDQLTETAAPIEVVASRSAIARALDNLLDNAAIHGSLPIRVEVSADGGGGPFVDILDAGELEGRPADLFAPFARGEDARSRPGSGLGLGIVQAVAHAAGGSIKLERLASGGTRARLQLPT